MLRGFGYALGALAILWFALGGACSIAQLSGDEDLPTILSMLAGLAIFSPIVFGPPLLALLTARSALRRARSGPPAADKMGPVWGGARIAIGLVLIGVGIWLGAVLVESAAPAFTDRRWVFFNPLYGGVVVLHMLLVALLMVVGGAWLALTAARDSGLWRGHG